MRSAAHAPIGAYIEGIGFADGYIEFYVVKYIEFREVEYIEFEYVPLALDMR